MRIIETDLEDLLVIEPKVFKDTRGFFYESYNKRTFQEVTGQDVDFIQDNLSRSGYGVLRGLHFQINPFGQSKLVTVLKGEVLDVVLDIRKGSSTYGKYFSLKLNEENKLQVFVPKGFAHGFIVLSEYAEFHYKCDNYYAPDYESGICYNDPELNIDWELPSFDIKISEKDRHLKTLKEAENNFSYPVKRFKNY